MHSEERGTSPLFIAAALLGFFANAALLPKAMAQDPGCTATEAWKRQTNPRADPSGRDNLAYPEADATYWSSYLTGNPGTVATISGQFPAARYMSLQIYGTNGYGYPLDGLHDNALNPDPGQNNPFRSGGTSAQGHYTIRIVFGYKPSAPPPNTMYTAGQTSVGLVYRVYYPNNPNDLTGGTNSPTLPNVTVGGIQMVSCPPRPLIIPQSSTVWGSLNAMNFTGTQPPVSLLAAPNPVWSLSGSVALPYINQDAGYMSTTLSRQYLTAPYLNQLAVIQMRPPTFANTQAGTPPYFGANVRYWSICTDDPISSGVVRCAPDNTAQQQNGLVTFVISDPGNEPSPAVLHRWGAVWIAWGALEPGDSVYGPTGGLLTNADGVFYYNHVIYRQLLADPTFGPSINNVSLLPTSQQQAAMGDYWPKIGYCPLAAFAAKGTGCVP